MTIMEKINADMKTAMKAKDKVTLGVLRSMKAAIVKESQIKNQHNSEDVIEVTALTKEVKSRQKSIEEYKEKTNRQDKIDELEAEIAIIEAYTPKPLTEDETKAVVDAVVAEYGKPVNELSMKDMGPLINSAKAKIGPTADGELISTLVRNIIQGK
jgi:gatB/yqey domain protein